MDVSSFGTLLEVEEGGLFGSIRCARWVASLLNKGFSTLSPYDAVDDMNPA